jgi:hypothetical protein
MFCLAVSAQAQGLFFTSGGGTSSSSDGTTTTINGSGSIMSTRAGSGPMREIGIGSLQMSLRAGASYAAPPGLTSSYSGRSSPGSSYFTRSIVDSLNQEFFGYEVLLEQQQPGTYLATFRRLTGPPLEMGTVSPNWRDWKVRELTLPEPRVVHDGDVIGIELTGPAAPQKLYEDIKIAPYVPPAPPVLAARSGVVAGRILPGGALAGQLGRGAAAVPTVEGTARDFTAADAEMQIRQPRIFFNGEAQPTAGRGPATTTGSLIWFYLPGQGRYILSLAPLPELDFQKAGEVRGGSLKFTLGPDTITLECLNEIASGHAPYILYVLRDPLWEPTARAQKGQFAIGSVDAGELAELKRQ